MSSGVAPFHNTSAGNAPSESTSAVPTSSPTSVAPSGAITNPPSPAPTPPAPNSALPTTPTRSGAVTGTASTSPASTTFEPSGSGNGGKIAGAAIGCLIAGALLGFVLGFLFYRRRSRSPPGYSPPSSITGHETKPADVLHTPTIVPLSKFLLDSTPDKEIAAELQSLGTLIHQHVENHYHLQPSQADSHALALLLSQLGIGSAGSLDPDVVAQLALDPRTRQMALQHVISQVVFASVDVNSRSQLSMLPAPIAAFLQSIPPQETGEKDHEVLSMALNQWRALAAFILHPARSQRTPLPTSNAGVAHQAAGLADALDNFLGCFVMPGDEQSRIQQRNHIQAVIAECTKFGYVLLSQPTEWRFVHSSAVGQATDYGAHSRVLVVCAGLVKATQADGTPYPTPINVVAPTTVAIQ